jgi:hypothetical protein
MSIFIGSSLIAQCNDGTGRNNGTNANQRQEPSLTDVDNVMFPKFVNPIQKVQTHGPRNANGKVSKTQGARLNQIFILKDAKGLSGFPAGMTFVGTCEIFLGVGRLNCVRIDGTRLTSILEQGPHFGPGRSVFELSKPKAPGLIKF